MRLQIAGDKKINPSPEAIVHHLPATIQPKFLYLRVIDPKISAKIEKFRACKKKDSRDDVTHMHANSKLKKL